MNDHFLTYDQINEYRCFLQEQERMPATIEKYMRAIRRFNDWLAGRVVTKKVVAEWKEHLQTEQLAPVTINAELAALNGLFHFLTWDECRTHFLKVQRRMFRDSERELSRSDYNRLVDAAYHCGRNRLALVIETICATGIRVSEVQYITVEAAKAGRAEIALKGKIRTILLSTKLCRKLLGYARKNKITSGEIFLTGSGKRLSRKQIWAEMKSLSIIAGIEPEKVFPHNLRHLFATVFYHACKDIARLADVLGHSSIETTRIYLLTSGAEHRRELDQLDLVS
ncbi:MAG: tyrosine-type recombinase/integrase [Oscillospiraceae bacterium]